MEDIYYVYIFLDQRKPGFWKYNNLEFNYQPFYVGKGKNYRIKSHFSPTELKKKYFKSNKINSIINETGELPIHYRIFENLSEKEAYEIEIEIIKFFGKESDNTGILTNLSDGGDGSRTTRKNAWKKVYQYDLEGNFLKEWDNLLSVKKAFANENMNISRNIKKGFSTYGFQWKIEYYGVKIEKYKPYKKTIKYKDIKQIDLKSGDIIKIHADLKAIESDLKLNFKSSNKVADNIRGKNKSAFGYKWEL